MFYSSTGERAARQDAKFLIRREIWPSTGSNRVGRLVEGRYSSETTDIPKSFREQFFSGRISVDAITRLRQTVP